jgi:hypothetical protein
VRSAEFDPSGAYAPSMPHVSALMAGIGPIELLVLAIVALVVILAPLLVVIVLLSRPRTPPPPPHPQAQSEGTDPS